MFLDWTKAELISDENFRKIPIVFQYKAISSKNLRKVEWALLRPLHAPPIKIFKKKKNSSNRDSA